MRRVIKICVVLHFLLFIWGLYSAAYWGWLTATPLDSDQLQTAKFRYYSWLAVSLVSAACFGLLIFLLLTKRWEVGDSQE